MIEYEQLKEIEDEIEFLSLRIRDLKQAKVFLKQRIRQKAREEREKASEARKIAYEICKEQRIKDSIDRTIEKYDLVDINMRDEMYSDHISLFELEEMCSKKTLWGVKI